MNTFDNVSISSGRLYFSIPKSPPQIKRGIAMHNCVGKFFVDRLGSGTVTIKIGGKSHYLNRGSCFKFLGGRFPLKTEAKIIEAIKQAMHRTVLSSKTASPQAPRHGQGNQQEVIIPIKSTPKITASPPSPRPTQDNRQEDTVRVIEPVPKVIIPPSSRPTQGDQKVDIVRKEAVLEITTSPPSPRLTQNNQPEDTVRIEPIPEVIIPPPPSLKTALLSSPILLQENAQKDIVLELIPKITASPPSPRFNQDNQQENSVRVEPLPEILTSPPSPRPTQDNRQEDTERVIESVPKVIIPQLPLKAPSPPFPILIQENEQMGWHLIPQDLFNLIFTLTYESLPQCSLVNSAWKRAAENTLFLLLKGGVIRYQDLSPQQRSAFLQSHSNQFRNLIIDREPNIWNKNRIINIFSDEIVNILKSSQFLETIDLDIHTDKDMCKEVGNLKKLATLKLRGCWIHGQDLAFIGPHENLTSLLLEKYHSDTTIKSEWITQFKNLTSFTCHYNELYNHLFQDRCMSEITKLQNLTHLQIGGAEKGTGLPEIDKLTQLNSLAFYDCEIKNEIFNKIVQLNNLSHLWVNECRKIEIGCLSKITQLTKLIYLQLDKCENMTDAVLAEFSQLKNLKWLDLSDTKITEGGIVQFNTLIQNQFEVERFNTIFDKYPQIPQLEIFNRPPSEVLKRLHLPKLQIHDHFNKDHRGIFDKYPQLKDFDWNEFSSFEITAAAPGPFCTRTLTLSDMFLRKFITFKKKS